MKFKASQKELYRGINISQRAVSSKNTMPVLTGIYLETKKEKGLHLIATDLELGIENWIEAEIIKEGSIVIPAKHLKRIIRELPDETINFNVNPETFEADINCINSEFNIKGFNPEEFPQLPEVNIPQEVNISTDKFKTMIEEVNFSTSTDQTQPALTGVLTIIDTDNIKMIATNTYRLAYSEINVETEIEEKIKAILPGDTLNELSHLLESKETIKMLINPNYISFNFQDITVISRLIEGEFPNYNQVIPDDYNTEIKVEKTKLKKAVKRVSLIARLDSNIISLAVEKNKMIINSTETETGHAHEEIDIKLNGPEQNINIDAGYLLDVLKVLKEEEVTIQLIGPLNPLIIKRNDEKKYIYLIMPVRPGS